MSRPIRIVLGAFLAIAIPRLAAADLAHDDVVGAAVTSVTIQSPNGTTAEAEWSNSAQPRVPGRYVVRYRVSGNATLVPHCNGRERVFVDGAVRDVGSKGPLLVKLDPNTPHEIAFEVRVSTYEKRIACSEPPRTGTEARRATGLGTIRFASPHASKGGGQAVVFVPEHHDRTRPATLLVGTHPWNGGPWTYAAYAELLDEASRRDVVLLMPSGLGNSLYVEEAEDEVMRAIDALSTELPIDAQRVSIWGASMGGAGATTIAFHRPDRFAFVASFFGDSRYDLTTYVKSILGDQRGAHRVNSLDIVENARHLSVLLVHGDADRTSPIVQSSMLERAMKDAGFAVEFVRAEKMGHEGPLVVAHVREVVRRAAAAIAEARPSRVSYRSVRASDTEAYGVRLVRTGASDAFVDLELRPSSSGAGGSIAVHALSGVREIVLAKDALGASGRGDESIVFEGARVPVRFSQ